MGTVSHSVDCVRERAIPKELGIFQRGEYAGCDFRRFYFRIILLYLGVRIPATIREFADAIDRQRRLHVPGAARLLASVFIAL